MAVEGYRLERIDEYRWRVPRTGPMLTDGLVFADDDLIPHIEGDKSLQQVANVACLPGIQGPSIAMPDNPRGYVFRMASNLAVDHIRRGRVRDESLGAGPMDDAVASREPGPDSIVAGREEMAILMAAVEELPDR